MKNNHLGADRIWQNMELMYPGIPKLQTESTNKSVHPQASETSIPLRLPTFFSCSICSFRAAIISCGRKWTAPLMWHTDRSFGDRCFKCSVGSSKRLHVAIQIIYFVCCLPFHIHNIVFHNIHHLSFFRIYLGRFLAPASALLPAEEWWKHSHSSKPVEVRYKFRSQQLPVMFGKLRTWSFADIHHPFIHSSAKCFFEGFP